MRRIWAGAVLGSMLLVAGCAQARPASAPRSMPDRGGSHLARAVAAADRVIAHVPAPPGLHRISNGAPYGLAAPATESASDHLVDRGRVWVGTGTVAAARRFLDRHLPAGATRSGSASTTDGSVPGRAHRPSLSADTYTLDRRWQQPDAYADLTLQLAFTVRGSQVAVRADAQAIYLPTRTADQHVPATVTGLELVATTRTGSARPVTVRRHGDRTVARRLAADLNALLPVVPAEHSCPAITRTTRTTLRFTGGPSATYDDSACGGSVTLGRGPALQVDARFVADVRAALR